MRKDDRFASAMEFVTVEKQRRVIATAQLWLTQNETALQPRFDVVEVYAPEGILTKEPKIHHIEDAFQT